MFSPSPDSAIPKQFLEALAEDPAFKPSPLEEEVVGLFNQLRNPLLRHVRSLGLLTPDGEEVVQEVFLALFQHLQQGKSRANLKGWLFRVGHNLGLKRRMRGSQRARVQCAAEAAENQADPALNPEEQMASTQRQQRLMAAVGTLSETDRCCLYLRAEGLRYREIAETLGISLGGVSLSLSRSLAQLGKADES